MQQVTGRKYYLEQVVKLTILYLDMRYFCRMLNGPVNCLSALRVVYDLDRVMRKVDMSMSKTIDNLDTAARAAGFAMAGSDEGTLTSAATDAHGTNRVAAERISSPASSSWNRQMAAIKSTLNVGASWSPWKLTA